MALNLPQIGFRLNAAEAGAAPDYQDALQKGFKSAFTPGILAQSLLGKQLENKLGIVKEKYAEPLAELELKLKHAQINKANRPAEIGGEIANLYRLRNSFREGSNDRNTIEQILANKAAGSQGIHIGRDPETGEQFVQIGGTGNSSSRGQGGKINEYEGGEITSAPTQASLTALQQRITGLRTSAPFFEDIKKLGQFQTGTAQAMEKLGGLSNYLFHTNFQSPSIKQAGHAAVVGASEGLIKSFGLNGTGGNRKALEHILTPGAGESQKGYENRIDRQLAEYISNQKYAESAARRGIQVGNRKKPGLSIQLPALGETDTIDETEYPPDGAVWGYIDDPKTGEAVRLPIPRNEIKEFIADGGKISG